MPYFSVARMVEASKRFGLNVEVVPGAETRGSASFNPFGLVGHHTAGPKTGDRPSLNICVNGRSDLAGPLCNDFLARSGTNVIVAAGRANHAGAGGFRGLVGNSAVWGIEAEDDGDGTWTDAQLAAYPRLVAARLWLISRDASWYCAHRTWAPTRKIDPTGIADDWMRARVAPLLASGGGDLVPALDATDLKNIRAQMDASVKFYAHRAMLLGLTGAGNTGYGGSDAAAIAPVSVKAQLGHSTYILMYGDDASDDKDPNTHPNNLQTLRTLVMQLAAASADSAAREAAMLAAVKALADQVQGGVDYDRLTEIIDQAAQQAVSGIDVVFNPPAPPPAPTA